LEEDTENADLADLAQKQSEAAVEADDLAEAQDDHAEVLAEEDDLEDDLAEALDDLEEVLDEEDDLAEALEKEVDASAAIDVAATDAEDLDLSEVDPLVHYLNLKDHMEDLM
jgi:hypothetical protein